MKEMEIFKGFRVVRADSTYLHMAQAREARQLRTDYVLSALDANTKHKTSS